MKNCSNIKNAALHAFKGLEYKTYGTLDEKTLPNTLSISFEDIDAEALILILKMLPRYQLDQLVLQAPIHPVMY